MRVNFSFIFEIRKCMFISIYVYVCVFTCVCVCVCVYTAIRCRTCTLSLSERLPQETILAPINIYRTVLKTTVGMYIAPRVEHLPFRSDFDRKKIKFYSKCMQAKLYDSWFNDSRTLVCMQTE